MSNKKTSQVLGLFSAGLLFAALAACGGGGSSGGTVAPAISGKASAPGGAVVYFQETSVIQLAANFLMPMASAEISGLQPVQNATVELIQVNNDGNQVGEVLASTQTSVTGDYQISLPAGIDFAANLVLRITSTDLTQTLDAQVVSQTVNIDPYSDYLLDKLVENGTQLDTLATNEVLLLKGKLEEFDLTAANDMSEMLAALEEATGEFMDQSIQTVNNGDGDANNIAGDYHFGEFALSLHDSDADPYGTFSTELIQESVLLGAEDGANIIATFDNQRIDTWFNLQYVPEGNHQLYLANSIENFPEEEAGTVDGTGALVFEADFEEEIQDCDEPNPEQNCFGWRTPAATYRIEPVGTSGLYVGRFIDASIRYHLTSDKVLDPNNKAGDEVFYALSLLAKKGTDMSEASLSGEYGMIGLLAGAAHQTGITEIEGFYAVENFDGAGNATETDFNGYSINRAPNSAPNTVTETTLENFSYTVANDGTLVISFGQESDSGFVSADGNLIAAFSSETQDNGQNPATILTASNGLVTGVKLPVTTPGMAGKSYKLYNLMFGYGNTDTTLSSFSGGLLSFENGSNLTLSANKVRGVSRDNDNSNLEGFAGNMGIIAQNTAFTIGNNGKFNSKLLLDAGETVTIDGFVSESADMILFRTIYQDTSLGEKEVGLFIGSLVAE